MGIKVNFAKPGEIEYNITTRDDRKFVMRIRATDPDNLDSLAVTYIGSEQYQYLVGQKLYRAIDALLRDGCAYKGPAGIETRLI